MIKFELTEDEVRILSEALGNMPFAKVVALVQNLQKQVNEQQARNVQDSRPANG